MNNSIKNKELNKLKSTNLDWNLIQSEMKNKMHLGTYLELQKK